jgi:hypothetical protein
MPWRPSEPGERPTLGWLVLDWISENLIVQDGPAAGEPLTFTSEQAKFILELYEVDPAFDGSPIRGRAMVNARLVRRAVLSRPKGWGKSPLVAALCLAEALAPVVLDGWDVDGQPVGREWNTLGFKPKVQIVAVSEDQTANTWDPCLEMARNGPVYDNYPIDPMETFINVPRGRIEAVTSSGTSREGFRPVFSAMDQTESWTSSNGGIKLAATIRRNLGKVNGCSVETPNAFEPGVKSVAENSFAAVGAQSEGRTRLKTGMLFDHREAPPETDPADEESLRVGLAVAYGDSADVNGGWVNLDRVVAEYWDPDTDPQDARRFYLNQITHATDSWLSQPEWAACVDVEKIVADREAVTLGFDGSRHRTRGVADATALIACRVADGHVFEPLPVSVWEQPSGPGGEGWEVPAVEVDAAVHECFRRYNVVGFYADTAGWADTVARWEAKYNHRLAVKATRDHPVGWSTNRPAVVAGALERLRSAIAARDITHDGSFALTRHVLNARRDPRPTGVLIRKEHPQSARKIDAAYAAMLAHEARLAAVSSGAELQAPFVPRRIR